MWTREIAKREAIVNESVEAESEAGRGQIVDTRLLFSHNMGWSLTSTFIPGTANVGFREQLDELQLGDLVVDPRIPANNLREVILRLIEYHRSRGNSQDQRSLEALRAWIDGLQNDSELLLDDSVIVHASPPEWASLSKIVKAAPEASIIVYTMTTGGTPIEAIQWIIAYGGARIILRLVAGSEDVLTNYFERWRRLTLPEYQPRRDVTIFATAVVGAEANVSAAIQVNSASHDHTSTQPVAPPPDKP